MRSLQIRTAVFIIALLTIVLMAQAAEKCRFHLPEIEIDQRITIIHLNVSSTSGEKKRELAAANWEKGHWTKNRSVLTKLIEFQVIKNFNELTFAFDIEYSLRGKKDRDFLSFTLTEPFVAVDKPMPNPMDFIAELTFDFTDCKDLKKAEIQLVQGETRIEKTVDRKEAIKLLVRKNEVPVMVSMKCRTSSGIKNWKHNGKDLLQLENPFNHKILKEDLD